MSIANPGERFRVRFNERGTFRLQWAEMLNGANDPVASGSIYYVRGRFDYASDDFDAPIPSVPISSPLFPYFENSALNFSIEHIFYMCKTDVFTHDFPEQIITGFKLSF